MKKLFFLLCCGMLFNTLANATNCQEVKDQIAEKIKANNVPEFTLQAVEKGTTTDHKIVGVCGGGTKDIIYQRGASTESNENTDATHYTHD